MISGGGSPFRELARRAPVYNYHRGALEGSTVNIIASDSHAQQLQSTLGNAGQSDQLPVPHGHHRQQRLTYSTPSSGSLSASSGGSVASKKMNQAGRMMGHMNQSHMQQHTQQAQQQQGRCGTHGSHLMARVACLGGGFCCGLCAVTQGQKHDPACHAQC